jgi:DNA repair exonuclease SbcCD ATPase subunit
MSDKFLKAVVEDAAGLDKLQSASDIAIAKNKAQSEQVVLCLKRRDGAMIAVELLENDLQKEKERAAGKKAADEERRAEVYKQLFEVVEEIKAMPALLGEDKLKRLENNKAKIDSQIKTAQGDEKEKLWQMQQTEKSLQSLKDVANVNLTHATAKVDKLQRNLDLINSRIGQPCGECGKTYHAEDIEAVAEKERGLVEVAKSQREALEADVKRAETAINDAVAARKSFEASMTDVSDLLSVRAKIDKLINNEKHNAQLKQEKEKAVARLNKDIESIEEKITKDDFEFQKYSADQLEEIDMAKCNLKVANEALEAAEKQLELTAAAVEVFGRAGVRGFILDTVTPFLNERTAQYLGALTDGNITANWTTLSKTAKGEIREKFTIDVEKKDGAKTFAGLSGGEKRKVRLSTAFALQDLVASRATKPIGFQFLDEIDTALDSAGVERLMGILEERGREKGTILVVSHNDLKSYITNSITVTNKGGIAKVTLETE